MRRHGGTCPNPYPAETWKSLMSEENKMEEWRMGSDDVRLPLTPTVIVYWVLSQTETSLMVPQKEPKPCHQSDQTRFLDSKIYSKCFCDRAPSRIPLTALGYRWATVSGFNSWCQTLISVCNQPSNHGQLEPSLPPGSVNEYQLRLIGRQRQMVYSVDGFTRGVYR